MSATLFLPLVTVLFTALSPGHATEPVAAAGWSRGALGLESIGELAFGPECLFVSDPMAGAIHAVRLPEAGPGGGSFLIDAADVQIASLLGTEPDQILVVDLAVDPASGATYLSVLRGRGEDSRPVLIRTAADGFEEVLLDDVEHSTKQLSNAPENQPENQRNPRLQTITDMAFSNGRLYVTGLSNEEFASRFRSFAFPFADEAEDTAVEIYHGNHGAYETRAPIRTFLPLDLGGESHLVAAYTCTPLVTFPVDDLTDGSKVVGRTVAELGGGNRPLDMIAYEKGGERFLLISNNRRGVMKLQTSDLERAEAITTPAAGRAGVSYETVEDLEGIVHMDPTPDGRAVAWIEDPYTRSALLATIEMP